MNFKYLSAAVFAIGMASPAVAQDAAAPSAAQPATVEAGATIYGSDGTAIGTVARAEGELLLLNVDERAVPIPRNAVTSGDEAAGVAKLRITQIFPADAPLPPREDVEPPRCRHHR